MRRELYILVLLIISILVLSGCAQLKKITGFAVAGYGEEGDPAAMVENLAPGHHAAVTGSIIWMTNIGTANSPEIVESQYTIDDTFGFICTSILDCKPGNNVGEYNHGCSSGTMQVFTSKTGWAEDADGNGFPDCTYAGEDKGDLENIDSDMDGIIDALDDDNDGDGIPNVQDIEPDSKAVEVGTAGTGKPIWWCEEHPGKC
jgi:hypothetical protein